MAASSVWSARRAAASWSSIVVPQDDAEPVCAGLGALSAKARMQGDAMSIASTAETKNDDKRGRKPSNSSLVG
ncbi:MAG: hypothetical protein P4M05_33535 [Bradyrhizobium sp.]|nr:hypothetical protein [Bradyrhizobium sp.]